MCSPTNGGGDNHLNPRVSPLNRTVVRGVAPVRKLPLRVEGERAASFVFRFQPIRATSLLRELLLLLHNVDLVDCDSSCCIHSTLYQSQVGTFQRRLTSTSCRGEIDENLSIHAGHILCGFSFNLYSVWFSLVYNISGSYLSI